MMAESRILPFINPVKVRSVKASARRIFCAVSTENMLYSQRLALAENVS